MVYVGDETKNYRQINSCVGGGCVCVMHTSCECVYAGVTVICTSSTSKVNIAVVKSIEIKLKLHSSRKRTIPYQELNLVNSRIQFFFFFVEASRSYSCSSLQAFFVLIGHMNATF